MKRRSHGKKSRRRGVSRFERHLLTAIIIILLAVLLGWVIFRLTSLDAIAAGLRDMLHPDSVGLFTYLEGQAGVLENMAWLLPAVAGSFPIGEALRKRLGNRPWYPFARGVWALLIFYFSLSLLLGATYNPFIYFRF